MELIITKPERKDYPRVVEVINSQIGMERALYDPKEYDANFPPYTVDDLISSEKKRTYLIAKNENGIVGFSSFYLKPNNILWISEIVVLITEQRKGIGSQLLTAVENEAVKLTATAIALETQKLFTWAIKFYRKNNYKILTAKDLQKPPFKSILPKPPVESTLVFGKIL